MPNIVNLKSTYVMNVTKGAMIKPLIATIMSHKYYRKENLTIPSQKMKPKIFGSSNPSVRSWRTRYCLPFSRDPSKFFAGYSSTP